MTMKPDLLRQVAELPKKTSADLRLMWKDLYDSNPPPYNKHFLVKRLAYRLQELAYGGLSPSVEEQLERMGKDEKNIDRHFTNQQAKEGRLLAGTRLIREWKGVDHCCIVLDEGFEYQGRRFKSLSAVARTVTGTRWNGLKFWGLKKHGDSK
jgi:hypothetical protein